MDLPNPSQLALDDPIHGRVKLIPILHDNHTPSILKRLPHLCLFLRLITARIPNSLNLRPECGRSAALAVLNSHTLARLLAQHLHGMQIDRRIRLTRWLRQRACSRKDILVEIFILSDFLNGRHNSPQRTRAHDRHLVFALLAQPLQHLIDTHTRSQMCLQLRNDLVFFAGHVFLQLGGLHLVFVLGLQRLHHAAEVLPDELVEELRTGIALGNVARGEDFVGELGASFEGELFGEDEGVVAVEEEGGDLWVLDGALG